MTEARGKCLCGAVRVTVMSEMAEISACHCDMCRRWSGSMQMGIEVAPNQIRIEGGPISRYRSSSFAERAWCKICGSALWFKDLGEDDPYEVAPGLFENAGGARLVREVYADKCPDGYAFAGDLQRVSQADFERQNKFVPEGESQ
ncbi:GFA family protein [Thalassococcus sp. S3]|uniref:GFA family protein n=1 Tax=Thalassococcus sp. S3 TaxID=2017482 RepID=UPI0013EED937|nr:GFA family protein [Thalassococcus sp. S3]